MERSGDGQEGRTLPPVNMFELLARDEARAMIIEHLALCPFTKEDISGRLRNVEISLGRLIGFMLGSGLLGGAAGALVNKILP